MPDTKVTNEHATHAPKKTGCCGGDHTKDQKATQKEQANPSGGRKHEHVHQSRGDSGCCGSGKANK